MLDTSDLCVFDLMIMNYIVAKSEEVGGYPRIPISEIAIFIGRDMMYVIDRLRFLEKKKLIIIRRGSEPMFPTFLPADKVHKNVVKYKQK